MLGARDQVLGIRCYGAGGLNFEFGSSNFELGILNMKDKD